jgi:hypothetical protein
VARLMAALPAGSYLAISPPAIDIHHPADAPHPRAGSPLLHRPGTGRARPGPGAPVAPRPLRPRPGRRGIRPPISRVKPFGIMKLRPFAA